MRTITSPSTRPARWLLALSLVFAASLLATDKAAAAAPFEASGTFVETSSAHSEPQPVGCGCVVFFDQTVTDTLFGTLNGSGTFNGSCQVRVRSGRGVCVGTFTFTGTVAGRTGTAQIHDVILIDDVTTGASHGSFSIVSGTGGLANLRGHATVEGNTYNGQFLFAT
jgi:hypothetical protein